MKVKILLQFMKTCVRKIKCKSLHLTQQFLTQTFDTDFAGQGATCPLPTGYHTLVKE